MMRNILLAALAVALLPVGVEAQRRGAPCCGNPFTFSAHAGAYSDAYDIGGDDSSLGWLVGFRAGYTAQPRLHLRAELTYAEANDIAPRILPSSPVVDAQWVLLTGGVDFDLVPGRTSIAVGGEAGIGWRQTPAEGDTSPGADGWGAYDIVSPSLTVRHGMSPRASVYAVLQNYMFDILEGDVRHSPALKLGLSFR